MIDDGDRLSEEEARCVWKRAAELQAAEAEPRSRAPDVPAESGHQTGYNLVQVREAAAEAGIAPEFVARALAEAQEADIGSTGRANRWAQLMSGRGPRSLVARRCELRGDRVRAVR